MSFELFAGCALDTREDIAKIKEFSSIPQYHGLIINIRAHLNDDGAQFLCDALSECQRKHFFGKIKIDLRKLRSLSVVDTQNLFSKCAESISNFLINFKNLSGFYFSLKHVVEFPVDFELFLTPLKLQKDLKEISLTSCHQSKNSSYVADIISDIILENKNLVSLHLTDLWLSCKDFLQITKAMKESGKIFDHVNFLRTFWDDYNLDQNSDLAIQIVNMLSSIEIRNLLVKQDVGISP